MRNPPPRRGVTGGLSLFASIMSDRTKLPDFILIEFDDYCGPAFIASHPNIFQCLLSTVNSHMTTYLSHLQSIKNGKNIDQQLAEEARLDAIEAV